MGFHKIMMVCFFHLQFLLPSPPSFFYGNTGQFSPPSPSLSFPRCSGAAILGARGPSLGVTWVDSWRKEIDATECRVIPQSCNPSPGLTCWALYDQTLPLPSRACEWGGGRGGKDGMKRGESATRCFRSWACLSGLLAAPLL